MNSKWKLFILALVIALSAVGEIAQASETSIAFSPDRVVLRSIGRQVVVTIRAEGIEAGTQGVQITLLHPGAFEIISSSCVGIFENAFTIQPRVLVSGDGVIFACVLIGNSVSGTSGDVATFTLKRTGNFGTIEEVTFLTGDPDIDQRVTYFAKVEGGVVTRNLPGSASPLKVYQGRARRLWGRLSWNVPGIQ